MPAFAGRINRFASPGTYGPDIPSTPVVWLTGAMSRSQEHTMSILSRFAKDESGATAIEYGLIAGLISVVIITALTTIGTNMRGKFNAIGANLS
jgi:pilus assembly protein Flp/PilA